MNAELSQANDYYKKAQVTSGLSAVLKRSYLEKAISTYTREMSKANLPNRASVLKNLGLASLRLGEVLDPKFDLKLVIHYLAEAVKALTASWSMRPEEQKTEWGGRIEELISECFERACRALNGDTTQFYLLDQLSNAVGPEKNMNEFRVRYRLTNGQYFYRCGVKTMEEGDFKTTTRHLEYARQEMELALQSANGSENSKAFLVDITGLEEDICFLKGYCDTVRLREQADSLFDTYVLQTEELNFEMVWHILDLYKSAEVHCRKVDIENEAIVISRQARVYYKILKLKPKAHTYYREAFDLAQTLFPKDMSNCDWFKECKMVLEEMQKAKVAEEEAKKEKEKAPYLKKMTAVLTALKAVHNLGDPFKLLKYIYSTHPPKVKFEYDEKSLNHMNIKKSVMKAITQYHPDKQMDEDMEWRILSEEITKCLTVRYEHLKGTE